MGHSPTTNVRSSGVTACRFERATWGVGCEPEVFLDILEAGSCADEIARVRPFRLFCKTGAAPTSHGLVAFLLWSVHDHRARVAWYEHFINPYEDEARRLLLDVGEQSHLKVVVYDSDRQRVADWFELENVFRLGDFASFLAGAVAGQEAGDFSAAQAEFKGAFEIEELLTD